MRDRRSTGFDDSSVELGGSVEAIQSIVLLESVGELSVAVPEHPWIVQEHADQAGEALVDLLLVLGSFSISPRGCVVTAAG
jgi:hypothetical protein